MTSQRKGRMRRSRPWLSRIDRRILTRVVVIGLGAFLLGYALTAVLFFRGSNRPDVVTVPDLRSLSDELAERRLDDLGLTLQIGDSLPHPEVREGDVLAQSPLPGREVAPGTSVRVILSAGRPATAVPDVTRLAREPAGRVLEASGFRVQVVEVPHPSPAGDVVGVVPAPGTPVRLPAVVQLQVSAGPPLVEVPALFGMDEVEARAALEALGLRLGEVAYELSETEGTEMVVEQLPVPGDSVPAGGEVQVRIVTGRPRGDRGSTFD